jgi:S1-C subfamily serine protease
MEPGDRTVMTVLGAEGAQPAPEPERPKRRWHAAGLRRKVLIGLVLLWAVALTAVVLLRGGGPDTPAAVPSAKPSASDGPLSVPDIYLALRPSVVLIQSTGGRSAADRDEETTATGTGVIVNADGTVLTAFHVVDGAKAVKLTFADGTESAAKVAGSDAKQDIATLTPAKLPETLVPAVLGGGLAVGDDVVAVGNPLGLTATTTSGVVSALDRVLTRERTGDIAGLIQFDAAVNPGSSGGPLINDRGQVAGIVVALANPTDAGTFIGIGFAVPIGAALGGGDGTGPAAPPL